MSGYRQPARDPAVHIKALADRIAAAERRLANGVGGGGGGAVDSVNGQIGTVVLDAADVGAATAADLAAHLSDAADAHDASAVSFAPGAGLSSTDVQNAILEDAGDLAAHLSDSADAHDASAISYAGAPGLDATDVESALDEIALVTGAQTTPSVRAYKTTQNVPSATNYTYAFDSESFDTHAMHDNSSSNSRLVAPVTGLYLIEGHVSWGAVSPEAGMRAVWILESMGGTRIKTTEDASVGTGTVGQTVVALFRLDAGAYVELQSYQTSGTTIAVGASFAMTLIPGTQTAGGTDPVGVRAFRSTDLGVPNNTITAITMPSENYDLGTDTEQHSTSVNTSRLTCRVPGVYSIVGFIEWAGNGGAGFREAFIALNGTGGTRLVDIVEPVVTSDGLSGVIRQGGSTQFRLAVGDYIELVGYQTSGATCNAKGHVGMVLVQANQSAAPQRVTALPSSPYDGQEIHLVLDATNGLVGHFRYNAASASAYKWEGVGKQPSLFAEVQPTAAGIESTASTSYAALTTAGPSITVPFAGDWEVHIGASMWNNTNACAARMSYDVGGTGASDDDSITVGNPNSAGATDTSASASRLRRKAGLAATTALVSKYKAVPSGTASFRQRWMSATPVRVG